MTLLFIVIKHGLERLKLRCRINQISLPNQPNKSAESTNKTAEVRRRVFTLPSQPGTVKKYQGWQSAGQKGISPLPMAEIGEK